VLYSNIPAVIFQQTVERADVEKDAAEDADNDSIGVRATLLS
jgi:hypothetical protein